MAFLATATGPHAGAPELPELEALLLDELEDEPPPELLDELPPVLLVSEPEVLVPGSLGVSVLLEHAMMTHVKRPAEATRRVRFIKVLLVCHAKHETTRPRLLFAPGRTFAWIAGDPMGPAAPLL